MHKNTKMLFAPHGPYDKSKDMRTLIVSLILLFTACSHPRASVVAFMDPSAQSPTPQKTKILLAFSSSSIEAKKFAFELRSVLEKQYEITQDPQQSDYHLVLQIGQTTSEETTYQTRSNPNFMMATANGQVVSFIHPAYVQVPISQQITYKSLHLDLYQNVGDEVEKIWESTVLLLPNDFARYMTSLAQSWVPMIGQDVHRKIRLDS